MPKRPGARTVAARGVPQPAPAAAGPDAPQPAVLPDDAVEVAFVTGAHGVRGEINVKPHAAQPEALHGTRRWYAALPPGPRRPGAGPVLPPVCLLRVLRTRTQGDHLVAAIEGVGDRDAAEGLVGATLHVARSSFPSLDDDTFYWVDLIGLEVRNREGVDLGVVTGLIETGPHCVLRIAAPSGATSDAEPVEVLVPFVGHYVDRVDLPGRCVHVDWQADY